MRRIQATGAALITLVLIGMLNHRWGQVPPLGRFFSPQEGFWQNAVPVKKNYSASLHFPYLYRPAKVWLDDRLVPHIFASDDHDLYFIQGYFTARFRLWQMDLQTLASAGRISEILGPSALSFDREQRRKGMVYGAELELQLIDADPAIRAVLDAYTAGVNTYIRSLRPRDLPLEYKLLGYRPGPWGNLRTVLMVKYMADDLSGNVNDLEYTNMRHFFSDSLLHLMFPDLSSPADPIVPSGTPFAKARIPNPVPPPDSAFSREDSLVPFTYRKPDSRLGSNNWALSGRKTLSGSPILANDPHLSLNLPSLWFEVQLHSPDQDVYGASLPGAPGIVIGFNDSIAWGMTNSERDVKDFFAIRFRDHSETRYLYDGRYRKTRFRVERFRVRGAPDFYDTVAYTLLGPVIYDRRFPDTLSHHQALALHWQALEPSDELKSILGLNRARNYPDFLRAIRGFSCPAQNFVFASKAGDIALWQQGKFPLRWKDQGKYILPGVDSTFGWKGYIPFRDNPHVFDPERGFVSSANQQPTDSSYPYYYFGNFNLYRGHRINQFLRSGKRFSISDMMRLQNDLYDGQAAEGLPLFLHFLSQDQVKSWEQKYLDILKGWGLYDSAQSEAPTLYYVWQDSLMQDIYDDELRGRGVPLLYPKAGTTIRWLMRDSTMPFVDNIHTSVHESLRMIVSQAFGQAMQALRIRDSGRNLEWGNFRGTDILHLARIPAFSHLHLFLGGSASAVDAIRKRTGPSWRMIVQLSPLTRAYGIYPGGQSGNPGSPYYDDMISDWMQGRYYPLIIMKENQPADPAIRYRINLSN